VPGLDGQWSMVNGQWSMVNGQWSMVNGQWSMAVSFHFRGRSSYFLFIRFTVLFSLRSVVIRVIMGEGGGKSVLTWNNKGAEDPR
jgi:hypothetical protein